MLSRSIRPRSLLAVERDVTVAVWRQMKAEVLWRVSDFQRLKSEPSPTGAASVTPLELSKSSADGLSLHPIICFNWKHWSHFERYTFFAAARLNWSVVQLPRTPPQNGLCERGLQLPVAPSHRDLRHSEELRMRATPAATATSERYISCTAHTHLYTFFNVHLLFLLLKPLLRVVFGFTNRGLLSLTLFAAFLGVSSKVTFNSTIFIYHHIRNCAIYADVKKSLWHTFFLIKMLLFNMFS